VSGCRGHPVSAFAVLAFGLGWPMIAVSVQTSWADTMRPIASYVALLGAALAVTWAGGGAGAVRSFLARFLIWRFGAARWAVVLLALPLLTVAVAVASGTFVEPAGGWGSVVTGALLQTLVLGAVTTNLAEEGGWSGLVQTRLSERHGLLVGALLTSPLFVAIHVPQQFGEGWTSPDVITSVVAIGVLSPFFRYVQGETLEATGGSLLAVGLLHSTFNACGEIGFPGGWQFLPAVLLLSIGLAVARQRRRRRERRSSCVPS
jgi:uncharacterized protein